MPNCQSPKGAGACCVAGLSSGPSPQVWKAMARLKPAAANAARTSPISASADMIERICEQRWRQMASFGVAVSLLDELRQQRIEGVVVVVQLQHVHEALAISNESTRAVGNVLLEELRIHGSLP